MISLEWWWVLAGGEEREWGGGDLGVQGQGQIPRELELLR